MKRITANEEACMGCGLCEVHCAVQHSTSGDLMKAYKKERHKPISRIRLEVSRPVSFAIQCRHCEDAPCVSACLSGAMAKDEETGLVVHNKDKCIGCWTCILVCPYGALRTDVSGRVVAKCDMCPGLDKPACVEGCPNGALVCREVNP